MAPRHIARTLELSGSRRYEFMQRLSLRRESRRNQLKRFIPYHLSTVVKGTWCYPIQQSATHCSLTKTNLPLRLTHSNIALYVGLPDAFCKNTGHFDLSTVPDLSCVVFRKRHRENRETISIVKPQLIICPYFGWLITFRCVCDVSIAPRIASTAANKLWWKNCPDKIHY